MRPYSQTGKITKNIAYYFGSYHKFHEYQKRYVKTIRTLNRDTGTTKDEIKNKVKAVVGKTISTDNLLVKLRATVTDVGSNEYCLIYVIGETVSKEETFTNLVHEIFYYIIGTEHGADEHQDKMKEEVKQRFRYLDSSMHQLRLSHKSLVEPSVDSTIVRTIQNTQKLTR